MLEKRLAQDLPEAGAGFGCTTGAGIGSPLFLGVGGGGKSEAVGAGGGGWGAGGVSGIGADFLECPKGDLFDTISGGPCVFRVMEIGMGALLGGSGGSRFGCSIGFSPSSLEGERFVPSRFCLLPNGGLGVETDCTGTAVWGNKGFGGCLPPEKGAAGPLGGFPIDSGTLLLLVGWPLEGEGVKVLLMF